MATKADDAHKHALQLMGHLIPDGTKRDAVHIAVAPVVSDNIGYLSPADPICFRPGSTELVRAAGPDAPVGIVDPYLKGGVRKGERFLMFLMPMSTTSLRHQWTHPAFGEEPETVPAIPYSVAEKSKEWIADWAARYGFTADRAIEAAKEYLRCGDYWCDGGTFEGESVPKEFWTHFERVTGMPVDDEDRESFTTCSC